MKRILFLSTSDLSRRSGGALGTLAYYNAICKLYPGRVDLMMPEEYCVASFANAIKVPKRNTSQAILSASLHRYKSFLANYLRENKGIYDVCFLNGGIYAGDMMDMIHENDCIIIVLHHNFEREYQMDNKSLWTLKGMTPFLVIRNEKKAYFKADCNLFVSQEDKELFVLHYGNVETPSIVTGSFEPSENKLPIYEHSKKNIIAITGSLNTIQTMSGIKDLTNNYYNIILDVCPNWKLLIAGRNPNDEVYNLKSKNPQNIEIIPNPENMDDIFDGASIYLCPTNVGGGIKLRVLDGLKAGLPILVHKVSSRGYGYYYDKPYFKVYHDKESFRQGLNDLVQYCKVDYNRNLIQTDFKNYFGFSKGCERLKSALELIYKK